MYSQEKKLFMSEDEKKCSRLDRSQEKTIIDVARGKAKCDAASAYINDLDKEFDGELNIKKGKKKKEPKDPLESYLQRKVINKIEGWADGFF